MNMWLLLWFVSIRIGANKETNFTVATRFSDYKKGDSYATQDQLMGTRYARCWEKLECEGIINSLFFLYHAIHGGLQTIIQKYASN